MDRGKVWLLGPESGTGHTRVRGGCFWKFLKASVGRPRVRIIVR